jgi:hypothetical protein
MINRASSVCLGGALGVEGTGVSGGCVLGCGVYCASKGWWQHTNCSCVRSNSWCLASTLFAAPSHMRP